MATNYGIKIDLLKLKGAFMRNLQGKSATKKCIIIPVDDCEGMFLGEKGCYLNMTAIEMQNPQYSDTHCIKPDIPKEQREAMSEEQRNAIPIIGGLHAIERQPQQKTVNATVGADAFAPDDEDLPF